MENLDKIVERVAETSECRPFLKQYLRFLGTEEDLNNSHVHLIYAEMPSGVFFLHGFFMDENDKHLKDNQDWKNGLEVGLRRDLVDILKKGDPKTFNDLLMLASFWSYAGEHASDLLPVKPFVSNSSLVDTILDEILNETKGYILWRYQLEKIAGIIDRNKWRSWCRDFSLLKTDSDDEWAAASFYDYDTNLKDVIEARKWVRPPTSNPPMEFAFRLYYLLFSKEPIFVN